MAFNSDRRELRAITSISELETCCYHGRACEAANSSVGQKQAMSQTSRTYLQGGNGPNAEDEKTIYENGPLGLVASDSMPPPPKSPGQKPKGPTVEYNSPLRRFYLGCRTKSEAEGALADRDSFAVYHALPVSHGHLRRQLKRGKDVTVQVELTLRMVHRRADGKFNHHRVRKVSSGVYVEVGNNVGGGAMFSNLEELLDYHSQFLTGKMSIDEPSIQ